MPQTADNIASDLGITREESDIFAAASQAKYEAARADGFFKDEIMLHRRAPGPQEARSHSRCR